MDVHADPIAPVRRRIKSRIKRLNQSKRHLMNCFRKLTPYAGLAVGAVMLGQLLPAQQARGTAVVWQTVVNNGDPVPSDGCGRSFNSYNPPSVNDRELVVFRARSKGGPPCGAATHGIYTRQMPGAPVMRVFDRTTVVPAPNNLGTTFGEPPAFPRIDMSSNAIATRANHQPVWEYTVRRRVRERRGFIQLRVAGRW